MKPIEQAFLADILKSPDDDFPRLIFADWLEENGQEERAEFIRVQCELAEWDAIEHDCSEDGEGKTTCPACGAYCAGEELSRRERELLSKSFAGELYLGFDGGPWTDIVFRRGFVEEATLPLAGWLLHGPALVKSAPLRAVRLSDVRLEMSRDGFVWIFPPNSLDLLFRNRCDQLWELARNFHYSEADALAAMSRCCLEYAHGKDSKTVPT